MSKGPWKGKNAEKKPKSQPVKTAATVEKKPIKTAVQEPTVPQESTLDLTPTPAPSTAAKASPFACMVCRAAVDKGAFYCPSCGTKLDWSAV